jgi:hypothetical protein
MGRKEFLAPVQVSREFKGKVKAYAFDKGFKSVSAMVVQALVELMEREGKPSEPVPWEGEK